MKKLFFSLLAAVCTLTASAQQVPTDGGSYYLYNTETGKFLTRGNDWGTRAVVNNYGQPWKVTVTDGKYKLQMLDMVNAGETGKCLNGNYSDNGTAVTYSATGDANGYVLSSADGKWIGVSSGYYVSTQGTDANKTWQFLNHAEYLAKQATIAETQNQAIIDASLIDATPATLASVLASATATDVTEAAGLSGVPTKSTWTETQHGSRGGNFNEGTYGLECYITGNAHITKTVNGLEQGIYKVKVKAMYRSSTNAACYATGQAGYTNSSAYFAANGYTVQVKDWYSSCTADDAPNSTTAAKAIMDAGTGYISEFYTYVGPSGTLNLEAVSEGYWGSCWFIFSGVELTKYTDYPTQKMADNTDLTSWLTNPSFETGNMNGWTNNSADGMWTMMTRSNAADPKVGTYWVEKYTKSGKIDVSQTLSDMPAGHYRVSVLTLDQASKTKLIAESNGTTIETPIVGGDKATYTADIMVDEGESLKIGLYCENHNASSWVGFDDFHLTFVSAEFPALPAAAVGNMNTSIAQAQTDAITTYNANKTAANYNAAVAAIAAAQESKNQYETAATNLTKANEILNSTNVYTAEARTAYENAISGVQTKYDNNTLASSDMVDVNAIVGPANYTKPKNVMTTYVASAWTATNGVSVYTNDWSWEGGSAGNSGMTTPFIENWVADANKLANTEVSATMTELPNGLYRFTADVRLMNNKTGDDAGFAGITFFANDIAPAMPEATTYPDGNLYHISIEALVKDGNLKMGYTVENTNVSWVAMKNVKYTKVRDLTPEEEAVVPTAITLDQTEVTLDAANNTATLVVTYTPADATEGITWATSDANVATVADGVVIGVAPGTATITATSTLDANVQATCVVTVEYPETAYETTIEEVDADNEAQINVTTLSSTNLIKNGSFEYPNGYYGFTYGNASAVNPISSTGFEIVEDNGNHYLKAKASGGGATDKSLCTAWPIENGKSYVFSFDIKANKSCTTDLQYIGTSLSNTTSEDANHKLANVPAYGTEWKTVKYQFTNSDNLKYLVFNSRWMSAEQSFDNFYLVEVADMSTIGNVDYAKSLIPTVNVGDAAFQYSQDAIDATNALVKGAATVSDVEVAIEAMTTLNEPAAGDKFHVAITYSGYRYSGHALESNGTSGVTVPLADNTANNNYPNDWTFTPVEGTKNGFTMSITTATGTYYVCTGNQDNGSNEQQIRMTSDPAKALTIVISPLKSQEGVYYLNNSRASNATIGCQDDRASNGGWYTTGNHNTHTITAATKATATLKIKSGKYGTFIAPFATEIPTGVKAYTCAGDNNGVLILEEVNTFATNTAYIVKSESEEIENELSDWGLATQSYYETGMLTGVLTTGQNVPEGSFILSTKNGVQGFYKVATDSYEAAKNKCYITMLTESEARTALFFEGDATAIQAIEALTNGDAKIYDLSGRQLKSLQKGINIVNGKTVLVK